LEVEAAARAQRQDALVALVTLFIPLAPGGIGDRWRRRGGRRIGVRVGSLADPKRQLGTAAEVVGADGIEPPTFAL
jgi:hypothetical protein